MFSYRLKSSLAQSSNNKLRHSCSAGSIFGHNHGSHTDFVLLTTKLEWLPTAAIKDS